MARLVAVDYDPFASQSAQPRLTPVDYDPFAPTLNANASGSTGVVNKKAEAIWGGSFDDWKKRKEADDAEQARMVAESEAGNVGSRRAQEFQRKVAALNKEGDLTGDYSADSLRPGRALESGMEQGREQIGAGLQFAGETPLALADFFGRIRPKGETEQDRSNPVTEAGKDIRGAAVARQQEIAPLMIDRPDSLLSMQGAKYIAQSALQSAPTTGTGLAAAVINPAAGLSLMGAGAGSAKFADARAEDKDYWLSAEAGAAAAAAEVVPEMLPLGFLSGRLLKHLPGTAMKRMASSPAGRGALLALSEGASEGVTELSNIAYEIAREGKSYSDDQIEKRLIDATAVGTVMGGGMAAVAEATGQSARAYDQSKIADLELENSLRAAIKPRATTARILTPNASPDAVAGAQVADDAFRAAGVGTVAASDIAEQDALARDLDAAQRDQLGSEAEIDRLLTGGINGETQRSVQAQAQPGNGRTVPDGQDAGRAGAAIPGFSGSLPAGVRASYPGDQAESGSSVGFVGDGGIGSRDAPAPQQFTELANGTIFVPGDPVQLRQRAADAGFDVRGLAETRNGVTGVRFGTGARDQIIGLFGGADPASAVEQSQPSAPPEAAAVIAPPALDAKRTYGDTVFDERAHDLLDFIALNGGLDRTALESEGIDPANWNSRAAKGKNDRFFGKPLFRKSGGMSLETLREKARDAGFRTDKDVLDLIGDSLGGRKTFTPAGSEYQTALADVARQEADAQARQQRMNALPPSVPETDADAYIASRETEFDAPADRDGVDLADIESTLASVADTSPQQRASTQSLGGDYTAKLLQYKKDRRAWGLNPQQEQEYQDLLELDRETGKVGGRPMVGVRNKTAYVDALDAGELLPVQGFTDADDFKTLNDKLGHAAGDDAIREIGDALVAEFGEGNVFHRSGDEFLFQGADQAEVDAKMQRVRDRLSGITLQAEDASGNLREQQGIEISYGTGTDEASADAALVADKQRRKESGKRVGERRATDRRGVGSEPAGGGLRAGEDQGVAEGVGDELRNPDVERLGTGDAGAKSDSRSDERPRDSGRDVRSIESARTEQAEPGLTVAEFNAELAKAYDPRFPSRLARISIIAPTWRDVPQKYQDEVKADGADIRLVAGFVASDGTIVLIPGNMQRGEGVGVTIHEVGVHAWMAKNPAFRELLSDFKAARSRIPAVEAAFRRAESVADRDKNGNLTAAAKATLDEEAFAYYVEQNWNVKSPLMTRIKDAIARLLNRLGIPTSGITDALMRQALDGMVQAARESADAATRGVVTARGGKIVYARDLLGEAPSETAQLVAQWKAKVDAKLRGDGRAYVKPSEGPGDLFGGPAEETSDLFAKPQQRAQGTLFSRKRDNSTAAEDRALDRGNLEEAIRIGKRRIAEQREALGDISNGVILKMDGRDSWAIVMPDVEGGGKWRMQMFDRRGFVGHRTRNSSDAALDEALQDKYTTRDDGALDEIQDSPEFVRGNFIAGEMMQLNAGKITSDEFDKRIADYDSSVKVVAKYSRKADGGSEVAESDKLVALHNVSPEGLLFADKIGGLAVPSIGITKAATPFTGFGSVTLIGSRDLATPSGDNPVFSADAFTQRFPDVEWPAVPQKKASDLLASLDSDYRRRDTGEVFDALVNKPDRDEAIRLAEKSAGFMREWVKVAGDTPADVVMKERTPDYRVPWSSRPEWLDAVDAMLARGVDVRNLREDAPEWGELSASAIKAIDADARYGSDGNSALQKEIRKMARDMMSGDRLSYRGFDRAVSFALSRNNAPEIDHGATRRALQDQIGDRMPQFSAWVASKIAPLFGEPSIRIGRKKVPMTLENVVEAMTAGNVAGKEKTITFGTGKAKAMNAKQYRTLEEIQADRAKIVAPEVEKDAIAHTDKLLDEYRTEALLSFGETNWQGRIDTWAGLDAATKALADAAKKPATATNVRSALVRNGFRNPSADAVRLGVESLIALRETVTDYFEAKPQRAVKLSEFAGAVVKDSEADRVRPVLEKHGVEVREYSGEEAERRTAIDELTKELEAKGGRIRFSRRADGGPESLRVVAAGDVVDGRTVREGVPNQSSISSSLDDYTILKGIREVPMDAFDKEYIDGIAEGRIDKRTQDLADAITESKEITPLIVAYDADGAYIIEGGHRLDALIKIGAKSLPAMVVIDEANPPKPAAREGLGASGPRYSRRTITIDGTERPTTDSTGKAIHPTEEGVRKFWEWFGSSKVVDESAVTKARTDVRAAQSKLDFDDSRLASLSDAHPLHPIITRSRAKHAAELDDAKSYLTAVQASAPPVQVFHGGGGHIDAFRRKSRAIWMAEAVAANTYGDGVGGAVYPLYARIENPMVFDAEGGTWQQLEFEGERVSTDDLADIAESRGHDGLVINNLRDEDTDDGGDTPATHYAVFAPEQVKSATGNSGAFSPTDKRIAYSRKTPAEARAESAQKRADLGAQLVVSPGQSFVYVDQFTDDWRGQTRKMRERIQDKLLSVRDAQKDIEQIRGAIEDAANVYRRENLMHGRVGDQRDKLQATHVKPLIEAMSEAKVSPALLEDYLEARHAKERNEKIAATKGGMADGASGMTTQQAEDFLQGRAAGHRSGVTLDPAMTRQVSRLARKVNAITAETRRRLLDSGQITQETFDALENAYAAYVPLRGKDGTESGKGRGTGKGIDVRGKPIQRAAGRGEGNRAQNILAEVIADAERSIINAEKLRVGRTLARLVLENPNPDVWAIEPVKTELKVSDGTPEEIYEAVKNLDQDEGTIIVKVKGKPYRIVIEDQRMADALKNMAVETVPEVIQYVAGLNRYFSAVLTRYNPSFVGVNMTRDMLFGMTGIWAEHGTAAAAKAAASYFPAMRAAWRDIQGKPPVNAMGRYAREFAEAGGKTYFGKLENVSDMSQRIGEEFKTFRQMAMPKFLGGEMSPVRALAKVARDSKMVQAIEAVNDTVENTLRLSVYAARREAGASIEQAAEYAKNISVNFNRRGSATSWLNALYLFFNAATQGAHRTLTLLKNPKAQGVLGGLAALQATSAMLLMGLDDEDGEPLWDSISSWDKQRNLILAIPIKREKGWGATVIKIPMPYGFNLFPYMGGRSVELARDLQEKPVSRAIADYTTDAVVGVAQAMSPIPFDDGWKAALPHWVRIFTVLSENKDDLGIPIRAGDQYDSFDKPRSASGRDDTPRIFKMMSTAMNRIGGGDDYTPPYAKFALDWAPEDLAYLFKTFTGGLGSNVVKTGTLTEKLVAGVPVNFKDVPVLSSFVSNVDQRQATSTRYYDHKDDIEREVARQRDLAKETGEVGDNPMGIKIARNKSGAKVKRGEGYELEGKPGSLFDTYKQAEKDISRIRDEMRAAFNDQSISYSERIRKIDELKAEREEVQRELNAAWREQRRKRTQ